MFGSWKSTRAAKSGIAEAQDLGRELEDRIEAEARKRLDAMRTTIATLDKGWQDRLQQGAAFVMEAATLRHALRSVQPNGIGPELPALRLQASSLFLKDCRDLLTSDPNGHERLHLVSGTISDDGVRVMSRIIPVAMDEASPAYVRAAPSDTHKKIVQLVEDHGHPLLAMFHSHMMRGAECTRPSATDIANQDRFCAIGWDTVLGGIFSLDGYLRLFSTAHTFTVSIYGKGAEIITDTPRQKVIKLATGG